MSGLNLSQRLWQLTDEKVQRAFDGFAATYDDTVKKLNNAFDFATTSLNIRLPVSSAGGFKTVIGPWQRSQATLATSPTALVWGADSNATGASGLVQGFYPTHPGSIIGMQLAGQAGSTTTSVTATVYKNSVATGASVTLALTAAGTTSMTASFAKGQVAFNAGERLDVYYTASAANTGQIVAAFTIEMVA